MGMNANDSLTNHFLIAMPALEDPNFSHTVTYICQHDEQGAMGIVCNRPQELTVREVLEHLEIPVSESLDADIPVYTGGPVQSEHGFVLHSPVGPWSASLQVTEDIALTTSLDILSAIAEGAGPPHYLLALGYAGWGAGQLEEEMAANAWLSGPADTTILFETPPQARWAAAAALLGVDLNLLSGEVGHS